jgi:hypothetical protein
VFSRWGERDAWLPGAFCVALLAVGALLACSPSSVRAAPLVLLDSRGWEMVSPVEKNGGEVQGFGGNFGGDVLQAAADGESATFSSASSFGGDAQGAPVASQYLSRRGAGGWSTADVTLPTAAGAYGENPAGVPYRLFSPDLARGLILNGSCEGAPCQRGYSLRQSAGGALTLSPETPDLRFVGTSPDLRHVILSTCAALTPQATEIPLGAGCDPADTNLYEWGDGQLELINVPPGESHGSPFASLAAPARAVSEDGARVYWSMAGTLYLSEGGSSVQVDEALTAAFQTASADGSFAFFIKGEHLYRYDTLTHKSTLFFLAPVTMGAGNGGLLGLVGASEDGSYVYYVGLDGALYLRHGETDTHIADEVESSSYPPATGTARLSADGTRLLFLSKAPLTGYDNSDQNTGKPDTEVFLYDAAADKLTCVSCNPKGVRPIGSSGVPGAIVNGKGPDGTQVYKPRALTNGGRRIFFDSRDALVTQDTNNDDDVYEWEAPGTGSCTEAGGCLQLISSGRSEDGASFVDASEDGRDAFFLTDGSLVDADPGAVDLYDAREGGGFPVPVKPIPCEGDACQPLPSPPEDPTPGTQVPTEGNPPVHFPKQHKPKKHKPKKHTHKHRKHHHHHGGKK